MNYVENLKNDLLSVIWTHSQFTTITCGETLQSLREVIEHIGLDGLPEFYRPITTPNLCDEGYCEDCAHKLEPVEVARGDTICKECRDAINPAHINASHEDTATKSFPFQKPKLDPNMDIPPEIMNAAHQIANWAANKWVARLGNWPRFRPQISVEVAR